MIYPRLLERVILKYLKDKEAIVILGARQVGKTSLMLRLQEQISRNYRSFYFDLERPPDLEKLEEGAENFIRYLEICGADRNRRNFVFVDEVHYLSDPAKFIKLIVDHYSEKIKLILSGSSSLEIKKRFKESMAGRKLIFYLYPLNFYEFLIFKGKNNLAELLPKDPFEEKKEDRTAFFINEYEEQFKEFLIFGGYPRVILADDIERKKKFLEEIASAYLYKDIRSLFNIDVAKFNKLVKLLALNISNLLNISSLSVSSGISRYLLGQYITTLEQTFIVSLVTPFFKGRKKELVKNPKIFYLDTGLRNYVTGELQLTYERQDIGVLLENVVYTESKKRGDSIADIHFWRTQNKTELDFILEKEDKIYPLEVNRAGKPTRALYSFMESYKVKKGYVCNLGKYRSQKNIVFLPIWWL